MLRPSRARRVGALVALAAGLGCQLNPNYDPSVGGATEVGTELESETAPGDDDASLPPIRVSNLRAVWTTPNQIRWSWDAEGEPDRLLRYELVTGPTREAVADRSGATTVWTEAQNPELGRFVLPHVGGVVRATTTTGHAPDTVVHAQLIAVDTSGEADVSNVAAGRTALAPIGEIVIFSEEEMPGYSLPVSFQRASDNPHVGAFHYRNVAACEGESVCWVNLRRQDLGLDLSSLTAGHYASTAYFEAAVAVSSTSTPWSTMWLWYVAGCEPCIARLEGWTLRTDGEYHVVQIPLRVLQNAEGPVPHAELAEHGLFGFNIGGQWEDGAVVDVDEVRIRW